MTDNEWTFSLPPGRYYVDTEKGIFECIPMSQRDSDEIAELEKLWSLE